MKKLLIIKTGSTFPAIREQFGDFEDMILQQCKLTQEDVTVIDVRNSQTSMPNSEEIAGIIITGSHAMVTEHDEWSLQLMQWMRDIRNKQIPTLGICYGHQLLAEAFGGKVENHPQGIEIGTTKIQLTEEGIEDRLLAVLSDQFYGHVTHRQTVITPPEDARILAQNDFEPCHAFAIDNHIWGVQFHPEFTGEIIHAYIEEQKDTLITEGHDIDALNETVCHHPLGSYLFEQFMSLALVQMKNEPDDFTVYDSIVV